MRRSEPHSRAIETLCAVGLCMLVLTLVQGACGKQEQEAARSQPGSVTGLAEPENLTDDEYAQLGWWLVLALRAGENFFVQYTAGALDRETWEARATSLSGILASPAGHKVWQERAAGFREDFQNWVASNLAERPSTAVATPDGFGLPTPPDTAPTSRPRQP